MKYFIELRLAKTDMLLIQTKNFRKKDKALSFFHKLQFYSDCNVYLVTDNKGDFTYETLYKGGN